MQPTDFDPSLPTYEDDWDARLAVWRRLSPDVLPEVMGLLLAEQLRFMGVFNQWMTPPDGLHHTDRQQVAGGMASVAEALTCKALLEWDRGEGGNANMEAAVRAMNKCVDFYRWCIQQGR